MSLFHTTDGHEGKTNEMNVSRPGNTVDLSVVVPAYNEEDGLAYFCEAVIPVLEGLGKTWELIFVNDGSRDGTLRVLGELHEKHPGIKVLGFSRNFGNQIAISAGLRHASGRAVVIMDADLQHPPEMIPEMMRLWEKEGYDSVYTIRTYGKEIGYFKRTSSLAFTKFLNRVSDFELKEGASDFRLLDRRIVDQLNSMPENSRFLRALISWLGFKEIGIPFTSNPRVAGESKFSFYKLIKLSIDGITGFSVKPLRWILYLGMLTATISMLYAVYVVFETVVFGLVTPGWPSLIIAILFLGGVQLISVGVLGEYIGRIYAEVKHRPLFVIRDKIGFDESEKTTVLFDEAQNKAA